MCKEKVVHSSGFTTTLESNHTIKNKDKVRTILVLGINFNVDSETNKKPSLP